MYSLDNLHIELRQPKVNTGQTYIGTYDAPFTEYIGTGIYVNWESGHALDATDFGSSDPGPASNPLHPSWIVTYVFREICAEIGAKYPPGQFPYPSMAIALGAAPGYGPDRVIDQSEIKRATEIIIRAKRTVAQWLEDSQTRAMDGIEETIVPPPMPPIQPVVQQWEN